MKMPSGTHYGAHIDTLRARYDQALAACGFEQLVIAAGAPRMRFLDDNAAPFRPNPHFLHWLPLTAHPDSLLVLRAGHRPRLIVCQPQDYWHEPPAPPAGYWVEHFDIATISVPEKASALLPSGAAVAMIGETDTVAADTTGMHHNPPLLLDHLHLARTTKTAYEQDCLRAASASAVRGHRAARAAFLDRASEFDIHLAYLRATRHTDDELPYHSIVALNQHGATLHYQLRDRSAPARSLSLLLDAGAACHGYAADVTRTWASDSGVFADLVSAVDQVQRDLCKQVRAGVDFADLHRGAHLGIATVLADSGLVALPAEDIVAGGISAAFYPHGLGHYLGLQVHDVAGHLASPGGGDIPQPPDHPFLRLTRTLAVDNVLTIEPGLYFIDSLLAELRSKPEGRHVDWGLVEELHDYGGVRVEDNVIVRHDGHENMTRTAFAAAPA